jgi:hypothetical protein
MRFAILGLAATLSCSNVVLLPNRLSKLACSVRTVAANQILCDGAIVAKVGCEAPGRLGCKALVIDYSGGGRTVLYQAGDFDLDKPEKYLPVRDGSFLEWALYPTLAPDGSKVWFKEQTPFSMTWREYDIAEGWLRDISEARLWEKVHFEYRDRDIPLAGPSKPAVQTAP